MNSNPLNPDSPLTYKEDLKATRDLFQEHLRFSNQIPLGRRHLKTAKAYLSDIAPYPRRYRILQAIKHLIISFFTKQF